MSKQVVPKQVIYHNFMVIQTFYNNTLVFKWVQHRAHLYVIRENRTI